MNSKSSKFLRKKKTDTGSTSLARQASCFLARIYRPIYFYVFSYIFLERLPIVSWVICVSLGHLCGSIALHISRVFPYMFLVSSHSVICVSWKCHWWFGSCVKKLKKNNYSKYLLVYLSLSLMQKNTIYK